MPTTFSTIDHDEALSMVRTVLDVAGKRGSRVSVSVVDAAGDVLAAARMAGAPRQTLVAAEGKARSAVTFRGPSRRAMENATKNPALGMSSMALGGVMLMPGGLPIVDEATNMILGAIGVSGSSQDETDAHTAMTAVFGAASVDRANAFGEKGVPGITR